MFRVIPDPQFVEDVPVPAPDGDSWQTQTLRTRYRALPQQELEALDEAGGAAAILERAVIGFYDLVDGDGAELAGMGEWRDRLLGYPHIRMALLRGYSEAVARHGLGNSGSSAAGGPPGH